MIMGIIYCYIWVSYIAIYGYCTLLYMCIIYGCVAAHGHVGCAIHGHVGCAIHGHVGCAIYGHVGCDTLHRIPPLDRAVWPDTCQMHVRYMPDVCRMHFRCPMHAQFVSEHAHILATYGQRRP